MNFYTKLLLIVASPLLIVALIAFAKANPYAWLIIFLTMLTLGIWGLITKDPVS